ncbi:hypothetical protein H105_08753 [Trichophyton soudanense CBS 452.61]|uniref:BTB domain-containing protein n=1 Tax=Trichophyton soudanense CBS 452.61 TaxID=1215331 RepID=A0A022XDE9_TRISD|nr:hypothetical protein H105_08753 [Trichophyton soudanense CBS 452.61]
MVSSRQLILASGYFREQFDGPWKLKHQTNSRHVFQLPLKCTNSEAFMILIKILHGHSMNVPRKVTLRTLTDIALLVDTYKCLEAAESFADTWICALNSRLPKTYSEIAHMWTYIAYVFEKTHIFQMMTKLAVKSSKRRITSHLPIPPTVFLKVEKQREALILRVLEFTNRTVSRLEHVATSNNCVSAAIILGTLSVLLADLRLLGHKASQSFHYASFATISKALNQLNIEKTPSIRHRTKAISSCLEALERGIKGLQLCDVYEK